MVDFDVLFSEFGDCFRLSEPYGSDFGMGEDYSWDVLVWEVGVGEMWWTEETVGEMASCCYGDCFLIRKFFLEIERDTYPELVLTVPSHPPKHKCLRHSYSDTDPPPHIPFH